MDLVLLHLKEKLWKNQWLNTTDMTFSAHNKFSQIIFDSTTAKEMLTVYFSLHMYFLSG